jgi:hypothetical protein
MIMGGLSRSRGFHSFYRVRAPAATRQEASALCGKGVQVNAWRRSPIFL